MGAPEVSKCVPWFPVNFFEVALEGSDTVIWQQGKFHIQAPQETRIEELSAIAANYVSDDKKELR